MMEVREKVAERPGVSSSFVVPVLLFSVLRERVGASQILVEVPHEACVRDVLDAVCRVYPQIGDYRSTIRVGLNAEYARTDDPVRDGDELALITPVSGG